MFIINITTVLLIGKTINKGMVLNFQFTREIGTYQERTKQIFFHIRVLFIYMANSIRFI